MRLTLYGYFTEIKGTHLQQHLKDENILLAFRVLIRDYQGILTTKLIFFSFIKLFNLRHCDGILY